jgi:hypothetical protein
MSFSKQSIKIFIRKNQTDTLSTDTLPDVFFGNLVYFSAGCYFPLLKELFFPVDAIQKVLSVVDYDMGSKVKYRHIESVYFIVGNIYNVE